MPRIRSSAINARPRLGKSTDTTRAYFSPCYLSLTTGFLALTYPVQQMEDVMKTMTGEKVSFPSPSPCNFARGVIPSRLWGVTVTLTRPFCRVKVPITHPPSAYVTINAAPALATRNMSKVCRKSSRNSNAGASMPLSKCNRLPATSPPRTHA